MELYLGLDPLESFRIRCNHYGSGVSAELQASGIRSFGGDSASWLRGGRLRSVGRHKSFSHPEGGASGLRSSNRSVVNGIDEV